MEFRNLGNGNYFPPILPNGEVHGYAPGVYGRPVHLMTLTDDGLQLTGLLLPWGSIEGVSHIDDPVVIHSNAYAARSFVFFTNMTFLDPTDGCPNEYQQGYAIVHALMNRITFELQVEAVIDSYDLDKIF